MKQNINKIKRMQQLAGILKEDMNIDDQGNLKIGYQFKIGQTVQSYGNEVIHKILDIRPNWEEVKEDPNDSEYIIPNQEYNLDDENIYYPWYLVEPVNTEEDGDYMLWWPENELELVK